MNGLDATKIIIFLAAVLAASWAGVALFRRWTLGKKLLDVPNDRSSHSVPTPRGGGLVIVAVSFIGYAFIASIFDAEISWGYVAGAIAIAAVSWFDDISSLPSWSRLIVHIGAAMILIADVGSWHEIFLPLALVHIPLGPYFGALVTVLWIVWLVNAYNFMDGIDGIAALQAVIACVAWASLAAWFDHKSLFLFACVLACSSAGFLIHNWQPARIFMGDVGSAFLGYTLASMPLLARSGPEVDLQILPLAGVLFVWFFIFDTLVTLIRRLVRRKRIWEAHREHLYQRMVIAGREHARVTMIYGISAALLASTVVLAIAFSGIFAILGVISLVVPTILIVYLGRERKDADLT